MGAQHGISELGHVSTAVASACVDSATLQAQLSGAGTVYSEPVLPTGLFP